MVRHRRGLSALLAALAVLLLGLPATRADGAGTEVVVAARTIDGGVTITREDLRVVRLPAGMVPAETLRVDQLEGRQSSTRITSGSVLTTSAVLSGRAVGSGRAVVGIRLADSSLVAMLRVGQRVTVVRPADGASPKVLTRGAILRSLPKSGGGLVSGGPTNDLVVISTDAADAALIAAESGNQPLGLVVE